MRPEQYASDPEIRPTRPTMKLAGLGKGCETRGAGAQQYRLTSGSLGQFQFRANGQQPTGAIGSKNRRRLLTCHHPTCGLSHPDQANMPGGYSPPNSF